ncbi:hypothetical protein Tco_1379660, partial [Tanacetum coccineum]
VMAIPVISVSSDSSEESVGTSTGRDILFGTIPTTIPDTTPSVILPTTHIYTAPIPTASPTIPPSPDYTPTSLNYSPVSDTEFDPSEDPPSDHIPPLPATLPFLSSTDDSSDSDILDTPPLPTHETSSDSSMDTLSDSASSRSSFDHSLPPPSSALSYTHADLLRSPKRIRNSETTMDLEDSFEPYIPREAGLGVDFEDESFEPSRSRGTNLEVDVEVVRSDGIDIDPETQAEINECIAYADALRARGINASVEGAVEVIESVQRDQGHRIVATRQQSADMLERIRELERDNMRLRDMMDVASQRVARSQRRELRVQREMRQIRRFRFYDRMRIARLEACARRHLGYRQCLTPDLEYQGHGMEMEEMEMVMGMEEEMAITLEDLCLLESAHIKTS